VRSSGICVQAAGAYALAVAGDTAAARDGLRVRNRRSQAWTKRHVRLPSLALATPHALDARACDGRQSAVAVCRVHERDGIRERAPE
jgi:hypothetical protein